MRVAAGAQGATEAAAGAPRGLDRGVLRESGSGAPVGLTRLLLQRSPASAHHRLFDAGNAAMATLLRPAPRATPGRTPVAQRFVDVQEVFEYQPKSADEQVWLADYSQIQALLADRNRVVQHLQALESTMVANKIDLSTALDSFEAGTWNPGTVLVRKVAARVFWDVVGSKESFLDLVTENHGAFTHRIQWFVIASEIKAHPGQWRHTAIQLYVNSVDERWRYKDEQGEDTAMWDHIVDVTGVTKSFSSPEALHKYLVNAQDLTEIKAGVGKYTEKGANTTFEALRDTTRRELGLGQSDRLFRPGRAAAAPPAAASAAASGGMKASVLTAAPGD